jgi:hypothetical protein
VIYRYDEHAAPDTEFAPGRLADLVPGNRGRLLDPRRTPVTIVALSLVTGQFSVRVDAFEDAGAVWEIPFEDAGRFQFALGGAMRDTEELEAVVARLDRPLVLGAGPDEPRETRPPGDPPGDTSPQGELSPLAEEREAAREWVRPLPDLRGYVERRAGEPELYAALRAFMDSRGVGELERGFAERFVGNPWSGELVKGHAIVLAELGLCPFRGKVVRDPALFDGDWSRERRAAHLLARMAFVQELFGAPVTVFRGSREPETASFVSATFSRAVAEANIAGRDGVVREWVVPAERLFMTFIETEAMNGRYREAEAVLLGHQTLSISAP